jgi:4-hydroxybenzoyl-CoA reductase subunit alpha
MTGHATKEAAEELREKIAGFLAEEMNVDKASITFVDGMVKFDGAPGNFEKIRTSYIKEHRGWTDPPSGEFLTFREASRLAFLKGGTLVGTGKYKPHRLGGSYKGAAVGTSPAYGCSAQIVEVSVDLETGQITVDKMTDAHDCGLAINKMSVEGQMQGSLSMGLGECLFEEVKFDSRGRVLNPSLGEYKIPTALDMPNVKSIIVESNEPNGPYGAKEVGEGAIMPTIPAILNAIYDATGVRINELPVTSEKLFMALVEKNRAD